MELEPLKSESLKEAFIRKFEELILSGELEPGRRLPSERDLAERLQVSRPVVHEGLIELAKTGLVTKKARHGWRVNDYRREGSIELLSSLLRFHGGQLDRGFLREFAEFRASLEAAAAEEAAQKRTEGQIAELEEHHRAFCAAAGDPARQAEYDFRFHWTVNMASGNRLYPLLVNSLKQVYTRMLEQFYRNHRVAAVVEGYQADLLAALQGRDKGEAGRVMKEMSSFRGYGIDLEENRE